MGKEYHVAVVGATGVVEIRMIELLAEASLPIVSVRLLVSKRSTGQETQFKGQPLIMEELALESFEGIDLALSSAGGDTSEKFAPEAVKRGTVVVDNTSHFRMVKGVPLVVPEMNPEALKNHQGIIADLNCSTIQMMVASEPTQQAFGLERIIVPVHQAVSDTGIRAINELEERTEDFLEGKLVSEWSAEILPASSDERHYPIAFSALPQIDVLSGVGYTYEEWKVMNEAKKIIGDNKPGVVATCIRIPVISGRSGSVYIEVKQAGASVPAIQELTAQTPGTILQDKPSEQLYS